MQPLQIHTDNPVFPDAAPHTQRAYRTRWRLFYEWTRRQDDVRLPASPHAIARYLVERHRRGASLSTIRGAATAISAVHRLSGLSSPTYTRTVQNTLRRIARVQRRPARRIQPLTDRDVNAIQRVARDRRTGRGGLRERRSTAWRRGECDIALVRLVSDASLRRSEAARLVWGDVTQRSKGRGLIRVRHSKTFDEHHEWISVSRKTMLALRAIRPKAATPETSVFGLSESQIHRRIKGAASAAGLGDAFGGNSGRAAARRLRQTRPSRNVVTAEIYSLAAGAYRTPSDRSEEPNQVFQIPLRSELRGVGPLPKVDATLPEEIWPRRPEYPNASPEE